MMDLDSVNDIEAAKASLQTGNTETSVVCHDADLLNNRTLE
jgi:hypothetical protein